MKMLVIDDSKVMRTFLCALAHDFKIETVVAEDGMNGIEVLEKNPDVEAVLVDWDMPRMNGLEFVEAVRANPKNASLKLMMVTTQTAMEKVCGALSSGADDFLMKPVTKESLEEKLRVIGVLL